MTVADLAMLLIGVMLGYGLAETRRWLERLDRLGRAVDRRHEPVVPATAEPDAPWFYATDWTAEAERLYRKQHQIPPSPANAFDAALRRNAEEAYGVGETRALPSRREIEP